MRDFLDLLTELPERSQYRKATGPEGQLWTRQDELLTTLVELVSVAATSNTRLRRPLELDRPQYPEAAITGPASDPAEVAAFFGMVYVPQAAADDQQED